MNHGRSARPPRCEEIPVAVPAVVLRRIQGGFPLQDAFVREPATSDNQPPPGPMRLRSGQVCMQHLTISMSTEPLSVSHHEPRLPSRFKGVAEPCMAIQLIIDYVRPKADKVHP
jgi:hypothetical protein